MRTGDFASAVPPKPSTAPKTAVMIAILIPAPLSPPHFLD